MAVYSSLINGHVVVIKEYVSPIWDYCVIN